jgi:dsDNA-binding SOS-regulon protein
MIKKIVISIDDIDYELPKEITVSHYAEVMRRINISESDYEKAIDVIAVLLKIPYQEIIQLDPEKMIELSMYLQDKINECNIEYQKTFKYNGVEYGGLNLMKMTFGEYIDLVSLIKNDISIYMNIHKICAILYRPIESKTKKDYIIKKYNIYDHEDLSEEFKELPVKYFFGSLVNLHNYLMQIKKDFVVLFGEDRDDLPDDIKKDKKEEEDNNLPWYKMIMAITDDDFTKIDYVTGRPVIECFNHLTYLTIKNEEIKQKQLEHQNKMNLLNS